jgi:hypothetical protein
MFETTNQYNIITRLSEKNTESPPKNAWSIYYTQLLYQNHDIKNMFKKKKKQLS